MTQSLEGLLTKAKEAPSPHEVRLEPLDTNPVFQFLGVELISHFFGVPQMLKNYTIGTRVKTCILLSPDLCYFHILNNRDT